MTGDLKRPDPDELLARVQLEEAQQTRGRLKLFLGYAAGVGKTYAMLEAAHVLLNDGVDVVVGYVETHGRAETEALAAGLEMIPRAQIEYRGAVLPEMDLDAVLARHPKLALVDELAHTNAPGARHAKRYLDVEELLDAGIDVYTTLNIQHLESLTDVVAQITGVTIREKVPDRLLDQADDIELIDLPPPELVKRLNEGKVYVPDQASQAIQKFFRLGNLTALREVAMRRAAERIDTQMRAYMRTRSIQGPWPAADRVLVAISPSPSSERLVHAARRLASQLDAEWFAVYVETPDHSRLSPALRAQVNGHLLLAQELGARVRSLPGQSVADTVIGYAHKHNVTKIIAGQPLRSRWSELLHGSVVDQIIRQSRDIDVYVITDTAPTPDAIPSVQQLRPHQPWWRYAAAVILIAVITVVAWFLYPVLSPVNLSMLYLLALILAAMFIGRGPSILAAMLSALTFDYLFIAPRFSFAVADVQYLLTFIGFFLVALIISTLMVRTQDQAASAQRREANTVELYELSRDLAAAGGLQDIVDVVLHHVGETFNRKAAVLMPLRDKLRVHTSTPNFVLKQNELAVADWAFKHGQAAGRGTATLSAAQVRCLPLKTVRGVVGVLVVGPSDATLHLDQDQRRLMEAFASQAAVAIERAQLANPDFRIS